MTAPNGVDTHAHIYWEDYAEPVSHLIQRAGEAGVRTIITPGTNLRTSATVRELAEQFADVYGAAGIHPSDVKEADEETFIDELFILMNHPKMVAVGEIGLDYYWDTSFTEKQKRFLHKQIQLALDLNKPVILHNRNSDEDLLAIISEYAGSGLRGIFHCFSGDLPFLKQVLNLPGFYISLAGNVTYKNSKLRELLPFIPLNRLLTETDSPFLAPVPFRGKQNEPARMVETVSHIATHLNLTSEDINRNVSANVHTLFGIGEKPEPSTVFRIGQSVYMNLTNRCTANCIFCDKRVSTVIHGYELRLETEPSVQDVLNQLPASTTVEEVVFAGPGEPFIRLDDLKILAVELKNRGLKLRVVTNGHGFRLHKEAEILALVPFIAGISIILPTIDGSDYQALMRLGDHGPDFPDLIHFAKTTANHFSHVEFVRCIPPHERTGSEPTELEGIPIRLTSLYHLV